MSEAMTNREIEDVLSSVRRLVAQEARPATVQFPVGPARPATEPALGALQNILRKPTAPEAPAASASVLVLSPSQRIDRPQGQAANSPEPTSAPRTLTLSERLSAPLPTGEAAAERAELGPAFTHRDLSAVPLGPRAATPRPTVSTVTSSSYFQPASDGREPRIDLNQLEAEISALEAEMSRAGEAEIAPQKPLQEVLAPAKIEIHPATDKAEAPRGSGELVDDDIAFLDESELRQIVERMVGDMVRERLRAELNGPFGEKMTLQIRKLIAQEFHKLIEALPN